LEQARRSTLADHVHRPSQLGPWVLINESWYKAPTREAQISTLQQRAVRTVAPIAPRPSPLRNLENIAAGTLAKWVKETTPNDRLHVIRVLRDCADFLESEMRAEQAA
jgi:hypothetical protein